MDSVTLLLLLGLSVVYVASNVVKTVPLPAKSCPVDYKRRVETCIMEAQVAPQAGGGITLVINNETIVDLCHRGLLQKTIDCLEEIRSRCEHNVTIVNELDRLYSVSQWQQGAQLLCQDTEFFQKNFECMSHSITSVMTCVVLRTQTFRMGLSFTNPADHARLREVTCNFAESIVKCLRSPLLTHCPKEMVKRIAGAQHLFLPPFCLTDNYITMTPTPMPFFTDETEH